jgi:membrane associated rhomboid family serine protease
MFRPGRFQYLPPVIKNLIIINGLFWLAQITIGRDAIDMTGLFALHYYESEYYKPWQFLTYMFMHDPNSFFHILFNMFGLWMFGSTLENLWGSVRFIIFYLLCGLGAGFVHMGALWFDFHKLPYELLMNRIDIPTLGASGAVMGIFAAFGYTFPNSEMIILPIPFPIKAKYAMIGLVVLDIIGGISNNQSGVAHFAHVGGAVVGILILLIWNKNNRKTFY